ncbi:MAG: DNA polymerase III subunit beta [Pirellulales bacterium]|nr:DNA polymerase III subunit beta [Pirellulales bacterium]
MKAVCEREKMLHAFQTAASVAPSRSPKPILQNIKLDVSADSAMLMGTDLEIGIRMEVQGFAIEQPGSIVLPIARFGSILRESSDEKLAIETVGDKTRVRGERSEFQLPSENPDEFPSVAVFEESKYHEVPARFFRELIRRTVFATDNESSRYALGGVLIEFGEDKIVAVATDGRRLAKQEGPAASVGGHHLSEKMTIIPSRAMTLIERAIAGSEENIQLSARDNDLLLKIGKSTIYTRLVEGRFPKWRDVFPRREGATQVELTVGPFYAAVRQAAIVTSEEHRGVDFIFGAGKLVLSGHGAEMGESRVDLPIAYDGEEVAVMLDPRYLNDFLRVLEPESTITLALRDSDSAVVCTTGDGYANVIMPLARDRR